MEHNFNEEAIEEFGKEHLGMPLTSPNKYIGEIQGKLISYLELKLIKRWLNRYLHLKTKKEFAILDIGAGKGRMTRCFADLASHCVALEPYPGFYNILKAVCKPYNNVETYNGTLSEYLSTSKNRFDFIYISGVTMYLNDEELDSFLCDVKRCLKSSGLVCVRDRSTLCKPEYSPKIITRSVEQILTSAQSVGLTCIRWQRAYPPFIFSKINDRWPNKLTKTLCNFSEQEIFFPIWELFARIYLRPNPQACFLVYLFY